MIVSGLLLVGSGALTLPAAQLVTQFPGLFVSYSPVSAWADVITPVLGGLWLAAYGARAFAGFGIRRENLGNPVVAVVLPLCILWRLVWRFQFVPASLQRMPCTLRVVSAAAALLCGGAAQGVSGAGVCLRTYSVCCGKRMFPALYGAGTAPDAV